LRDEDLLEAVRQIFQKRANDYLSPVDWREALEEEGFEVRIPQDNFSLDSFGFEAAPKER
jgi:hypothetical protein